MNRSFAQLTVALVLLVFAAAPVSADIVTISQTVVATADVHTSNRDPSQYFPQELVTAKVTDYYDPGYPTYFARTYLKFSLQSLYLDFFNPDHSNYTATLRLYYWTGIGGTSDAVDLYVYGITYNPFAGPGDNWQESNQWPNSTDHNYLAWNGQPIPLGEPVLLGTIPQSTFTQNGQGLVSCSLSMPWILSELQGDDVLTLLLKVDEAGPEGQMIFYSLNFLGSGPENVPQLILTLDASVIPVPVPPSLLLLGLGLLGLAGWRRFRKG